MQASRDAKNDIYLAFYAEALRAHHAVFLPHEGGRLRDESKIYLQRKLNISHAFSFLYNCLDSFIRTSYSFITGYSSIIFIHMTETAFTLSLYT